LSFQKYISRENRRQITAQKKERKKEESGSVTAPFFSFYTSFIFPATFSGFHIVRLHKINTEVALQVKDPKGWSMKGTLKTHERYPTAPKGKKILPKTYAVQKLNSINLSFNFSFNQPLMGS